LLRGKKGVNKMGDQETAVETPETTETETKPESTESKETSTLATEKDEKTLATEKGEESTEVKAPEKYEVKLPEGQEIDQNLLDSITPVLQKHNISQEAFNELVDIYAPRIQAMQEDFSKESLKVFEEQKSEWKTETLKELGDNVKTDLSFAAKARDKFGDEAFVEILEDSGLGNHPAVVRFLSKIGKVISDDRFVDGKSTGTPSQDTVLKQMYPTMSEKK